MKVKKVEETLLGPKHKAPERCAIFDPVTEELITDKNEILATTLKYNIGVVLPHNQGGTIFPRCNVHIHGRLYGQ